MADPVQQQMTATEVITVSRERPVRKGANVSVSRSDVEFRGDTATIPAGKPVRMEYTIRSGQGFRWLADGSGFFTAFHCEAWMICDPDPGERATLRLEVAAPVRTGWTVAGPGNLRERRRADGYDYFVFEETVPAQTYLFSFGAAVVTKFERDGFVVYARDKDQAAVVEKTRDAWTFLRAKAGADSGHRVYAQAFLPNTRLAQEASGIALMGEAYRARLAGEEDDVALMAHEAAHQWWGVLVGIRSWSDFWLNEGMAEFFTAAYLEHRKGRPAYDRHLASLKEQLAAIRDKGADRPLHWTGWTTAREALGRLPYVKGAVFLDLLRGQMGEDAFWRGIAEYTTRHAGKLVESRDFQASMEAAAKGSLSQLFDDWVYR
ncbi:MAG: M1 family aminopeptidase [Bryobacteraceae bacterium]